MTTVGAYAVGLTCCYCDISLYGYKAVDYFKLNDLVKAFYGMRTGRGNPGRT